MSYVSDMYAAIAVERSARKTAHKARIVAQTSCPHDDCADLAFDSSARYWAPYRVCLVCGLTLAGYQPVVLKRTTKTITREALRVVQVGPAIGVDAFDWHPDPRESLARLMAARFDKIWGES